MNGSRINNGRQRMHIKFEMSITVLKEFGLRLKVTAMESTQAKYFPHQKDKGASIRSSTLPYNTHHIESRSIFCVCGENMLATH